MLHPSQNGRVCHVDAALAHHGDQIAIAQLEAQIPPDAQNHDLLVKVSASEQVLDRYQSRHLSIIADSVRVCTRAAQPARVGETLVVTATGLGPTRPGVNPGTVFADNPPQEVNSPVEVRC